MTFETEARREAILFFFCCSEVDSTSQSACAKYTIHLCGYFKEWEYTMVCQIFDFTGKPSSGQLMKPTETVFFYKFVCAMSTRAIEYKQGGERLGRETSGPLLLNEWCRSMAWVQGRSDSARLNSKVEVDHFFVFNTKFLLFLFYGATKSRLS